MKRSKARPMVAVVMLAGAFAGCAVCTGCGGSAATQSRSAAPSSGATSGGAASSEADSATSVAPSTQSTGASPQRSSTTTMGGADVSVDTRPAPGTAEPTQMLSRDDAIAAWAARLAAAEQQFQAASGVCRDVCRASSGICSASRELCALTGDREGAAPTDPRCARARASCERASRQREGACPVCPE
jgi:hypothetical protein